MLNSLFFQSITTFSLYGAGVHNYSLRMRTNLMMLGPHYIDINLKFISNFQFLGERCNIHFKP